MEVIETPTLRELHETIDNSLPKSSFKASVSRASGQLRGTRRRVVARPAELMLLRHGHLQRPHPAKGLPRMLNPMERAHQVLVSMRLVRSTFARCQRQSFLRAHRLHCCIHQDTAVTLASINYNIQIDACERCKRGCSPHSLCCCPRVSRRRSLGKLHLLRGPMVDARQVWAVVDRKLAIILNSSCMHSEHTP